MSPETRTKAAAAPSNSGSRARRTLLFALGVIGLAGTAMALMALLPSTANAVIPLPPIDLLSGIAGEVASSAASDGFKSILENLFPTVEKIIDKGFIDLFTSINDPFVGQPRLRQFSTNLSWVAISVASVLVTLGALRYFASGYADGGGAAGVEALGRAALAIVLIASWGWIYRGVMLPLSNALPADILGAAGGASRIARGFGEIGLGLSLSSGGWLIAIVMQLALLLMLLALLAMRVMLQAGSTLAFVAFPLAVAVLPLTSQPAKSVLRALVAMLLVPTVWALCFATISVIGADNLTISGVEDGAFSPINSLAAIVLFFGMVFLPWKLAKMVMFNGVVGGKTLIGSTASGLGNKMLQDRVRQEVPTQFGGKKSGGAAAPREQGTGSGAAPGDGGASGPGPRSTPVSANGTVQVPAQMAGAAGTGAGASAKSQLGKKVAAAAATAATAGTAAPAVAPAAAGAGAGAGAGASAASGAAGAAGSGAAAAQAPASPPAAQGASGPAATGPQSASSPTSAHPSPSPEVAEQRNAMQQAFANGDRDKGREAAARAIADLRSASSVDTRASMAPHAMEQLDQPAFETVQRAADTASKDVRQSALIEEAARASERGQPEVSQALVTLGAVDRTTLREQVGMYETHFSAPSDSASTGMASQPATGDTPSTASPSAPPAVEPPAPTPNGKGASAPPPSLGEDR